MQLDSEGRMRWEGGVGGVERIVPLLELELGSIEG